jgi:hypothetical protein
MTVSTISVAVPRTRSKLAGRIVAVTAFRRPGFRVDVVLGDGTGTVTLRFLGRAEIPGMAPGRNLLVEGTPMLEHGALIILNPLYSFTSCPSQDS